jgi:Secretion system C-terminal sorting domain
MNKIITFIVFAFLLQKSTAQLCPCGNVTPNPNFGVASYYKFYPDDSGGCLTGDVEVLSGVNLWRPIGTTLSYEIPAVTNLDRKYCFNPSSDVEVDRYNYGVVAGLFHAKLWNENKILGDNSLIKSIEVNNDPGTFNFDNISGKATFKSAYIQNIPSITAPLSTELFWVAYAAATGSFNTSNVSVLNGCSAYAAQSFCLSQGSTSTTQGNHFVAEPFNFVDSCDDIVDPDEKIASMLLFCEAHFGDRKKFTDLLVCTVNSVNNLSNDDAVLAKALYDKAVVLNSPSSTCPIITSADLCRLGTAINKFYKNCSVPILPTYAEDQDYWIKNNAEDVNGDEPSLGGKMWESPDIVNYFVDSNGNLVEGAVVANVQNYMKVKITNIGEGNCSNQTLRVYYSVNLGNQMWPSSWTLPNGNELGSALINPIILPGESGIITIPWIPDVNLLGNNSLAHICFLARIVDTEDPAPGVSHSINHSLVEATGNWSSGYNVANFNGIAWRNMVLFSQDLVFGQAYDAVLFVGGSTGNQGSNPINTNIPIGPHIVDFGINVEPMPNGNTNANPPHLSEQELDPDFFEKVDVILTPGKDLTKLINNCNGECVEQGTYTMVNNGYKILNHRFRFKNLNLPNDRLLDLGVRVISKGEVRNCSFSIVQKNWNEMVFGGETYCVLNRSSLTGRQSKQLDGLFISPNPTSGKFTLKIPSEKGLTSIVIFDALGKTMRNIPINKEIIAYEIDLSEFNTGVYIVEVRFSTGDKLTEKIFKQ